MANAQKLFILETLRTAAKQSLRCLVVLVRLRRAIKIYLREEDDPHIRKRIRRRLPGFAPTRVLDFGAGSGSCFWYTVNLVIFFVDSKLPEMAERSNGASQTPLHLVSTKEGKIIRDS